MLRWDGEWVEGPNGDMVRRGDSAKAQQNPEPRSWEAHRRHRTFDQRGVIEDETHEAIRIRYHRRSNPRKTIGSGGGADPAPLVATGLGAILHGAVFWAIFSVLSFAPSPWLALAPAALVPIILGLRFAATHLLIVVGIGSLIIAFDSWIGWALLLPAAGVIAPGRWVRGEW